MEGLSLQEITSRIAEAPVLEYHRFEHPTVTAIVKEPLPPRADDPALYQRAFLTNQLRKEQAGCPLTEGELLSLKLIFTAWTGLDGEQPNELGTEIVSFTEEMMLDELNAVRQFCRDDLNKTFGLSGVLAEINECLFVQDLEPYNEEELLGYAKIFHLDLSFLDELQATLEAEFQEFAAREGVTEEQLDTLENFNEERLLSELKMMILDFRMKMIDRFRLWRWREQVLLLRSGNEFDEYPGVEIHHYFETAAELLRGGIGTYFLRVGECRRETLMDYFTYVEVYHLAGFLAGGVQKEVKFHTEMQFADLADLVILLIDEMKLNPLHVLSPTGVHVILNSEETENPYNLHHLLEPNVEKLTIACSQLGIELHRETEILQTVEVNGQSQEVANLRREQKPTYVLLEELAAATLTPQFFSAVENHRDWKSAITGISEASDNWIFYAEDGEILFYGVGDGMSMYRVYKPDELALVFLQSRNFTDPYTIKTYPEAPLLWTNFSEASMRRLLTTVLPVLEKRCRRISEKGRRDAAVANIRVLANAIVEVTEYLETHGSDNPVLLTGEARQNQILSELRSEMASVRPALSQFFALLFNIGSQFSDWDTMIQISGKSQQVGILDDPTWKMVDPETSENLTSKIYRMLVLDTEKYLQRIKFEPTPEQQERLGTQDEVVDFSRHVIGLRSVKHYQGTYRLDWDDDHLTIGGMLHLMLKYADLRLYPQLQTCGNWLMATSQYYSMNLLDDDPLENALEITDGAADDGGMFL